MKHPTDKQIARNCAFQNISDYLTLCGWKCTGDTGDDDIFARIDPLTGVHHRPDMAFVLQTDRDVVEMCKAARACDESAPSSLSVSNDSKQKG
jgi:hypothetical protein